MSSYVVGQIYPINSLPRSMRKTEWSKCVRSSRGKIIHSSGIWEHLGGIEDEARYEYLGISEAAMQKQIKAEANALKKSRRGATKYVDGDEAETRLTGSVVGGVGRALSRKILGW